MPEIIISDTSCLILLSNIGELDLLQKLYNHIVTTIEIANEFAEPLPDWIAIKASTNRHYQQILELQIDKGEASAIALAIDYTDCMLIVDDYKARRMATNLGIKITGTIGVIIKAKLKGIIPSIKPFFEKIKNTDFRLSEEIIRQAYLEAGEQF